MSHTCDMAAHTTMTAHLVERVEKYKRADEYDGQRQRPRREGDTETATVRDIAQPNASTGVGPSDGARLFYHSCKLLNNTSDKSPQTSADGSAGETALQTHEPRLRTGYGGAVIDGARIRNIFIRDPCTGQLRVDPYTGPDTEKKYLMETSAPTSLCMCLLAACLATHALALGTPLPLARLGTPYHTIPYHTIPVTTPHHTIPCQTTPYHIIPHHPFQSNVAVHVPPCGLSWHTPWPLERLCTGHALAHHTIP